MKVGGYMKFKKIDNAILIFILGFIVGLSTFNFMLRYQMRNIPNWRDQLDSKSKTVDAKLIEKRKSAQ